MHPFLKSSLPADAVERLQGLLDESARNTPEMCAIGIWCETQKVLISGVAAGGRLLHWQLEDCPTAAEAQAASDVVFHKLARIVAGVTASQETTALISRVRH